MELRPYQKEAKEAIFEQWDSGVLKTLLVLPTGCGKTVVFAKVTEECVRKGDRVLILAHRGELLDQAADKLMKTTGLGCALEKAESSCQGSWFRVVVGSVQTLMREKRLGSFPADYFNTIIQFLLGVVFQCNWHTTIYTVQLDQLCSLICEISCRTAAFTVDKCQFQILQIRLLAAFFTAVITKLRFGTEGLCLTTVFTADM